MRIFTIGKWSLNSAILGLLMALQSMSAHGVATDQGGYDGSADYFRVQRDQFQRAREALRVQDEEAFRAAYQQLQSYPLRPYLDYLRTRQEIEANPGPGALGTIKDFRAKHQDSQWTAKLERALLSTLARQTRWRDYLHTAAAVSVKPDQCAMLLARVKTQQLNVFDQASRQLWVRLREYPAHCEDAFATLSDHSPITVAMVWERVYALMDKGRTQAMKGMLPYLSRRDRATIDAWIAAWPKPGLGLQANSMFAEDTGLNRRIVLNLVERWAKRDSAASYVFWQKVRDQYLFSPSHKYRIDALIARMAAYDDLEEAHHWLHALPDNDIDKRIRAWRIRTGLRLQDWQAVLRDIGALPANERDDAQWRYWRARAAEQTGDQALARQLYEALATEQSYHGFLAAERIGEPYALRERATQAEQERMRRLALEPELIRAREYAHAGIAWEGRRLWMDAVAEMSLPDRYAAAALAARWHWADRAVFTVAKTGHKDALSLRFPMPHLDQVDAASDQHAIDASWIYGVMRRESGFIPDVRSRAGAVGLMQLMPATAKDVARRMGSKHPGDLTQADNNIRLGSYYLRYVMNRFDNHQILATAAYNAGPHRVKRWLPDNGALPADVWVDTIPYTETRRYVRAVTAYTTIFEWLRHRRVTPLSERMVDVPPEAVQVSQR